MSRTLVISDLHIGDPRFQDNYLVQKLLMEETFDRLVLNGDIVDLWLGKMKNIINDPLYKLIKDIALTRQVIWVVGNHDYKIEKFRKYRLLPDANFIGTFVFTENNHTILVLHGHQVYTNQNKSWCTRLSAKFNCFLWKYLGLDFQRIFNGLGWYESYVASKRKKVIQKFGDIADTIIMGHTHVIGCCHLDKSTLFDLGSAVITRSYAIIENGEVSMKLEKS